MIVVSQDLALTSAFQANANNPVVGYESVVTAENVSATVSTLGFPASNVANPATNLDWRADSNDEFVHLLLHCDGTDGSQTITDSSPSPKTVTVGGNAQIDTAESVFGGASLKFDGTTDFIRLNGENSMAFGTGDFTIEFWLRLNALALTVVLYDGRPSGVNGVYPTLVLTSANLLRYDSNSFTRITGTNALTTGRWYYVSLQRTGTTTRLYVDGVQEGNTFAGDTLNYLNGAFRPSIGANGSVAGTSSLNGWMDEIRISKGIARDPAPPVAAYVVGDVLLTVDLSDSTEPIDYIGIAAHNFGSGSIPISVEVDTGSGYVELFESMIPPDDAPLLYRFTEQTVVGVRLRMQEGTAAPSIGVLYVGRLLTFPRNIYVGHTPITYGKSVNVVTGRSESGNYLGRIVLSEVAKTQVPMRNLPPAWYRENINPFVETARETPFFFSWRPGDYPLEVGYVWMTNDPQPTNQRSNGMVEVSFEMTGIA